MAGMKGRRRRGKAELIWRVLGEERRKERRMDDEVQGGTGQKELVQVWQLNEFVRLRGKGSG